MQLRDLPPTVAAAREAGSEYYFTGKPCKKGHLSKRQTSNRTCVKCARNAHRKWVAPRREDERLRYQKWRSENLELARAGSRKVAARWVKENRERHAANCRTRKARKRNAEGRHTDKDIKRILKLQRHKCAWCKICIRVEYHVDHIMPLARGGSNWPSNIQCLCPTCNLSKHARDPIEFAQSEGRLL